MTTQLELRNEVDPQKFWEIIIQDKSFTIREGNVGDLGKTSSLNFSSIARAQQIAYLKTQQKLLSGYKIAFKVGNGNKSTLNKTQESTSSVHIEDKSNKTQESTSLVHIEDKDTDAFTRSNLFSKIRNFPPSGKGVKISKQNINGIGTLTRTGRPRSSEGCRNIHLNESNIRFKGSNKVKVHLKSSCSERSLDDEIQQERIHPNESRDKPQGNGLGLGLDKPKTLCVRRHRENENMHQYSDYPNPNPNMHQYSDSWKKNNVIKNKVFNESDIRKVQPTAPDVNGKITEINSIDTKFSTDVIKNVEFIQWKDMSDEGIKHTTIMYQKMNCINDKDVNDINYFNVKSNKIGTKNKVTIKTVDNKSNVFLEDIEKSSVENESSKVKFEFQKNENSQERYSRNICKINDDVQVEVPEKIDSKRRLEIMPDVIKKKKNATEKNNIFAKLSNDLKSEYNEMNDMMSSASIDAKLVLQKTASETDAKPKTFKSCNSSKKTPSETDTTPKTFKSCNSSVIEVTGVSRQQKEHVCSVQPRPKHPLLVIKDKPIQDCDDWVDPLANMGSFGTPLWKKRLNVPIVPPLHLKRNGIGGEVAPRRQLHCRHKRRLSKAQLKYYGNIGSTSHIRRIGRVASTNYNKKSTNKYTKLKRPATSGSKYRCRIHSGIIKEHSKLHNRQSLRSASTQGVRGKRPISRQRVGMIARGKRPISRQRAGMIARGKRPISRQRVGMIARGKRPISRQFVKRRSSHGRPGTAGIIRDLRRISREATRPRHRSNSIQNRAKWIGIGRSF